MRTTNKTLLLGSAAVIALGLGFSSEAKAFDDVNWTWNKAVESLETITIDVNDSFDISGMVEIEKTQVNIGDVTATSSVNGVTNNPPGAAGDGTFEGIVSIDVDYEDIAEGTNAPVNATLGSGGDITSATFHEGNLPSGEFNAGTGVFSDNIEVAVTGQVDLAAVGVTDAVDLPSVASDATAVGNNQSISSTVAVNLHDAQYNMGDIGLGENREVPFTSVDTGNTHTDILAIASLGAALDIIQQGSVTATSDVSQILNASVDSSATAVGNNLSVNLDANTVGDAFMVADLTQFNYADVSAYSSVNDVSVNSYANLGVLEGPLVNSSATAVGNNVSISVSSPEL